MDGKYTIPVPMSTLMIGKFLVTLPFALYELAIEAVDGNPTPVGSISFTTQIGNFFGQQNFNEELYKKNQEAAIELRTGVAGTVPVVAGKTLTWRQHRHQQRHQRHEHRVHQPELPVHLRGTDTEGRSGLAGGDGTAGAAEAARFDTYPNWSHCEATVTDPPAAPRP